MLTRQVQAKGVQSGHLQHQLLIVTKVVWTALLHCSKITRGKPALHHCTCGREVLPCQLYDIPRHFLPYRTMARSLSSLWLKNLRSVGKAQAQGRKLFSSLVPKAKPRKSASKPVLKAAGYARNPGATKVKVTGAQGAGQVPFARAAGLPGRWQKAYFSLPVAGQMAAARRMLYWLYLPSGAQSAADPLPLVIMLHGCQQTAADFATATRMNALAERKGFAVLYPQQSATADSHRCWHWYKRSTQQGQGDVRLIAAMAAHVVNRHALDGRRTYVAGLSAGAALACILGLRYPGLIAAVGLHSAPVFGTSDSPMSAYSAMQHGSGTAFAGAASAFMRQHAQFPGMPAILIHGDRDAVVRRVNASQLARQFVIFNALRLSDAEPIRRSFVARSGGRSPRHAYQTTTWYAGRKPQLVSCDISALGHAWSGGDHSVAFSAREGPDATLMIWTFFSRHQLAA
jgi:poly(hydroxyalkanoate) depolymerase family esterase